MSKLKKIEEIFKDNIKIEVDLKGRFSVSFPMYKVDGGKYPIYLIVENKKCYLSDEGDTYATISEVYDIKDANCISVFVKILKNFGCRKNKANAFTIECTTDDIHQKYSSLIQCLSFMRNLPLVTG